MICKNILMNVGDTPVVPIINIQDVDIYAKLEYYNPTESIKDRAASYVLKKLIDNKRIDEKTMIVESSSGNFGVSLAAYCKLFNLQFTCVIDPMIARLNEKLICGMQAKIVKVTEPDMSGGYLLNRIRMVHQILEKETNSYWMNQYENEYIREAYENTLGVEICKEFDRLDYAFICVSSGGTIAGVSRRLKSYFKNIRIIAVDIIGSVIFGGKPVKRTIPGIGSSKIPLNLNYADIDDVMIISEEETIEYCHKFLQNYSIFAGGSSGAVYAAANKYFSDRSMSHTGKALMIFPDSGSRYENIVY